MHPGHAGEEFRREADLVAETAAQVLAGPAEALRERVHRRRAVAPEGSGCQVDPGIGRCGMATDERGEELPSARETFDLPTPRAPEIGERHVLVRQLLGPHAEQARGATRTKTHRHDRPPLACRDELRAGHRANDHDAG